MRATRYDRSVIPKLGGIGKSSIAALAVAILSVWLINNIRNSGPYRLDASELTGWALVEGRPGEPGLVALEPPRHLTDGLFENLRSRTGQPLVAPARTLLPLVLQTEYEDSLQGVLSVDDVMRAARDSGIASARFDPVCIARQEQADRDEREQLFFVVFESPAFEDFRQRLLPLHTEHGGAQVYDPAALRPALILAATEAALTAQSPVAIEPADCQIQLEASSETGRSQ